MNDQNPKKSSHRTFSLPGLQSIGKDKFLIMILTGILLFIIALPTDSGKTFDSGKPTDKTTSPQSWNTPTAQQDWADNSRPETITDEAAEEEARQAAASQAGYTAQLEKRLARTLMYMEGVGKVKVMITLRSSSEKIVEKDIPASRSSTTETDAEGGSRSINDMENQETTVYATDENGNRIPYVIKNIEPAVEGVIVIAEGGGREEIRKSITEAVQALFDIEAHKIKVMKMKTE